MKESDIHLKVHFIGIGGIGVSALARYYLAKGWKVTGSDLAKSEITEALEKSGAQIYPGEKALDGLSPDFVVYSPAVKSTNAELKEARRLGIKSMRYPEALGELTKKYKTIAVAGAHGKSTTTAMIGLMMVAAKLDPTVIVGTKVKEFGDSNFRLGKSEYLVIEACEYDRSFLNYWPQIIVLTNIEMDHMECYGSESELVHVFEQFADHLPKSGALIACADDANVGKIALRSENKKIETKKYSVLQPEADRLRQIMKIPGEHNIANGLAALAVGRRLNIPDEQIYSSLAEYKGTWRRFDQENGIVAGKKIIVVSDYGHHPTQIKLTMAAARQKWPDKKIICVFQPHQAYRTHILFDGFVDVFKKSPVDKIFVTDIYKVAGRESDEIVKKVSSQKLVGAVNLKEVEYVPQGQISERLDLETKGGEIVLVMGAGNIYNLSKELVGGLKQSCD
ncbi:MAG: UDP-N-acetylmuramate--L-alanine ligase [Candidatus Paceibacterota bacterium]